MTKPELDLSVYLITSGADAAAIAAASAVAAAGVNMVQIRQKELGLAAYVEFAAKMAEAVRSANARAVIVVDDRVDAAWYLRRMGAPIAGVHLGQEDMPVGAARELLGPDAIIGFTTGTLELVEEANRQADVIDYIGAGPFRKTPTKDSGREPLGLAGYPALVAAAKMPVVAIGDVQIEDVAPLQGTGVAGVAMVRALMGASDPGRAANEAIRQWKTASARLQ